MIGEEGLGNVKGNEERGSRALSRRKIKGVKWK